MAHDGAVCFAEREKEEVKRTQSLIEKSLNKDQDLGFAIFVFCLPLSCDSERVSADWRPKARRAFSFFPSR